MVEQFGRQYKLQIDDLLIQGGLRVVFDVQRDRRHTPNNAELAVFNLGADHRGALEEKRERTCSLSAGYDDPQEIFLGIVRDAQTERNGPDLITRISAGDNEANFNDKKIDRTFRKGTPVLTVLKTLVTAAGIGRGNLDTLNPATAKLRSSARKLNRAMTFDGKAATELLLFCRSLGLEYSVQSGALQVFVAGAPTTQGGPLIAPETGLVGAPSVDDDGAVTGTALLLPDLVPGVLFTLRSERVSGPFVAVKTRHYGDTHGNEWYVEFQGDPL